MTEPAPTVQDITQLHPGEDIEVHGRGALCCRGRVEELMPALHVVWIREHGTGERRMFTTDDHRIHRTTHC